MLVLQLPPSVMAKAEESTAAEDLRLQGQIESSFSLNPYLRWHQLQVSVAQGHVTVTGQVDEVISQELASNIALALPGVLSVDNQVKVDANYIPTYSRGTVGNAIDDITISTVIRAKLMWCTDTDTVGVRVRTEMGHVTLQGQMASAAGKDLASILTLETRGVVSVDNQLQVHSSDISGAERAQIEQLQSTRTLSDSWIAGKVKVLLFHTSTIHGGDIEVRCNKGIVSLRGRMPNHAERNLAIAVAQRVLGVVNVDASELSP
jgi:hyperosmotically inducible protein